ncbi:MAG: hypothetical protein CFE30_14425 [Bradyrhizobium sp. PARBB1]|nr:MAG: hypothetical protein CFE30_14425 [Bradyrhizobium sp. PARBB1]PSO27273.1 hypothetical protein C7G43_09980 [Bradyrhizobium sp. MOS004]
MAQDSGDQTVGRLEDHAMPDWILAPICMVALGGFIWFAFRQGFSIKPDENNRDHPTLPLGPDGSWR